MNWVRVHARRPEAVVDSVRDDAVSDGGLLSRAPIGAPAPGELGPAGCFKTFYARRVLRIFPLYYAVVILSLVVLPHFAHVKAERFGRIKGDEFWYWTLLSNYAVGLSNQWRHGILDVTWSLAIEE